MMKNYLKELQKSFQLERVQDIAYQLNGIEKSSSYDDFERSAGFCEKTLKEIGFSKVRRIEHAADGVTTSLDCTMPEAWFLDKKKRSFIALAGGEELPGIGNVLADSTVNPLHVNIWSAPTPRGGVTAEVVRLDGLPEDDCSSAKGKWVLYMPENFVRLAHGMYRKLADAGAAGLLVADWANRDSMPDALGWFNGVGYTGWYLTKGEKHLPVFSVSCLAARALSRRMEQGKVLLHGEVYTSIRPGVISTVTGIIPGESREEIALFAHLYEPFVNDDAAGFAGLAEFGRTLIERKVKLKKTLRVVFSMELYGTSAYLEKYGKNIVLAANFDGVPYLESPDLLVRRMPFFCGSFTDFLNRDLLARYLPDVRRIPEYGSLSDDAFGCDPRFNKGGIPTFWLHWPCDGSHHNTGYLFSADWKNTAEQYPAVLSCIETLLRLDKLPGYSRRAVSAYRAAATAVLKNPELTSFEKKMRIQAEYLRAKNQLASVTRFTGQAVNTHFLEKAAAETGKKTAKLPQQEFTAAEYRALNLIPAVGKYGYPFSLAQIPLPERKPLILNRILWSLFDGKRSLLECIRMEDAETGNRSSQNKIRLIAEELRYLEKYGYVSLKNSVTLKPEAFASALQRLGLKKGMKVVVHTTFSSLGKVDGPPEALCTVLQKAVGKNGVLMMPVFAFQIYRPGRKGVVFDVENTPADTVGILAETFRKMPGVLRSFDPCHSFSVWGKNARKYVENHHLVPTVDPEESPLALLRRENGFVLTVSSASSTTLMHLVEEECGASCCGKRTEEYDTLLPDGQKVKTRAWGWRARTCKGCPANRTEEIFDFIRKHGNLRETMLGNAHLMLFSMEDYRAAYRSLMKKYCKNAAIPRKVECTVASDWDEKRRMLKKKTSAYTGSWMPCKNAKVR